MTYLNLEEDEARLLQELSAEVAARYKTPENPDLHLDAAIYAHEIPRRVRQELNAFKQREPRGALLVISQYPISDEKIGPTPAHWKFEMNGSSRCVEEAMLLVLFGSLLGDCIGWSTQQEGRIVHDILPIRGNEQEQLGTGSEQVLCWHTEDAFHPLRGDYLGMACLRNPDGVPTTFASLDGIELDPRHWQLLFEPHFTIRPDESHLRKNRLAERAESDADPSSYERIEQMQSAPPKIAVLYGDPKAPYLRLDPYFMDPVRDHPEAQAALDALIAAIERRLEDLVLRPGDFCFIDNYQGVHGRRPFRARYDGTDRWMKRINVVRDLRKSRVERGDATARLIR